MHRTVPGFRTLHFGDVVDIHLLDDERDNNAVIVVAARRAAGRPVRASRAASGCEFALAIAVETADALIKMAFRRGARRRPARCSNEAKALIKDYLHHRVV